MYQHLQGIFHPNDAPNPGKRPLEALRSLFCSLSAKPHSRKKIDKRSSPILLLSKPTFPRGNLWRVSSASVIVIFWPYAAIRLQLDLPHPLREVYRQLRVPVGQIHPHPLHEVRLPLGGHWQLHPAETE